MFLNIICCMIKISGKQNRYLPIKPNPKQNSMLQTTHCQTQCSTFLVQEQLNRLTQYFRLFESMKSRNKKLKQVPSDSFFIPKHHSKAKIEFLMPEESKQESSLCKQLSKNTQEPVIEHKKVQKRHSSYNMEPNTQRLTWIKTILRRKNNGSYGQIIRGLTGVKHESMMEKVQAISSYRQTDNSNLLEIDMGQAFVPLGSNKHKNEPNSTKITCSVKTKKKMSIHQKKSKINAADYFETNIRMKTSSDQKTENCCRSLIGRDKETILAKLLKKQSQPHKIQRHHLSPWDDL